MASSLSAVITDQGSGISIILRSAWKTTSEATYSGTASGQMVFSAGSILIGT
ncbi:MAG: hypothetical protein ACE14P_08230 [Methanotrichaceae archaeon]